MSAILQDISEKLQKGKMKEVAELVKQALAEGIQPLTILNEGLMPGMDIIGERFKRNDIFIPEVLIAARAMAAGTEVLRPLLVGDQMEEKGTVVIGTIKDDLHDIGKNLVRMMMESKGLNVIDLGNSVPPAKYIEAAAKHNADIICLFRPAHHHDGPHQGCREGRGREPPCRKGQNHDRRRTRQ